MGKIVRCSPWHMYVALGCDNVVVCNVTDATNVYHDVCIFLNKNQNVTLNIPLMPHFCVSPYT